jgi:hypothetical protein
MSAQKNLPVLPSRIGRVYRSHILLDRAPACAKTQLEQFATDAFRSQDADSAPPFPESTPRSLRVSLVCKKLLWMCISNTAEIPGDATAPASSSWTINRACFHARDARASRTKIRRSIFVHAGRLTCRRRMMSCWRRRAFAATSSDVLLARSVAVPRMREVADGCVQSTKRRWSA